MISPKAIFLQLLLLVSLTNGQQKCRSKVLLVSMDGFRWDYTRKAKTPNFDSLAQIGTHAQYINNSFITKTFPNHYTMATGLNEESHGIIGNHMYDPVFNDTFNMGTKETRWWNGGEPIWVTARKQNLKSATYFWPGSETEIRGYRPNYWLTYNESHLFRPRVDKVIDWFVNYSVDVATLYFHEPDKTGHLYGPDSPEVIAKVEKMDGILGYLIKKFYQYGLWNSVNLIVTSDHGMTSVDFYKKTIDLSKLVSMTSQIKFTMDSGPIMQIYPVGDASDLVQTLNGFNLPWTVYRKEDIPDYWYYKNNRRVMPVFAVAHEGWSIVTQSYVSSEKGNHGYDNRLMSMKPIFYAAGPNIKRGYLTAPFRNVDLYPMICELLGITASPNNGSLSRVQDFLQGCGPTSGGRGKEHHVHFNVLLSSILFFTIFLKLI